MSFALLALAELSLAELGAWRELAGRSLEPNPYLHPDFVLPAARGLGLWGTVMVACVVRGGEWVACLPIRHHSRWNGLPAPRLSSWNHSYSLLGTPLLDPDRPAPALAALVEGMRRTGGHSNAVLEWVPAEGPFAEALAELPDRHLELNEFSRATLRRRAQNDYLEGRVKGKHRREFRRLERGLEAELGAELVLVDRSGEEDAVNSFLALEAAGWKGRSGTALGSDPDHAEFIRETSRAFASRGALELLLLEAGGQVAAARYSLLDGDASFCFKVAYDERLSRFSPGRELELRLIDRFHDEGRLEWMDSCADTGNTLYERLWPDQRKLSSVAFPAPGVLGLAATPGIAGLAALRRRRRQAVKSS